MGSSAKSLTEGYGERLTLSVNQRPIASDQLERLKKQAVEKAETTKIQQLLRQSPVHVIPPAASHGQFRSKHHKQCGDGVHLTKNTGHGGDRASQQKTGQQGNRQQRQTSPGILCPAVEPNDSLPEIDLKTG